ALADASTLALTFNAGALPDQSCYTIQIGSGTLAETISGASGVMIRSLEGDANMSGEVTMTDALGIKNFVTWPSPSAPYLDINVSGGSISLADALAAKVKITNRALCP